jgi:anti-sigma factor RsiW
VSERSLPEECRATRLEQGAYFDGELPRPERQAIEAHLAVCEECREECARLQSLIASVRQLPRPEPPESLRHRLLAEIAAEMPAARAETVRVESRGSQTLLRRETRLFGASPQIVESVAPGPALSSLARQWRSHVRKVGGSVCVTVQTF